MAVDIDRDRTDGPVFYLVVECAGGGELFQLAPPFGDFEPAVVDLLEAMVAGEIVGAMAAQEDVGTILEQLAREADRCTSGAQPGHRAGPARPSVHDRGVKLYAAGGGQHAAAPRIETDVFFEDAH